MPCNNSGRSFSNFSRPSAPVQAGNSQQAALRSDKRSPASNLPKYLCAFSRWRVDRSHGAARGSSMYGRACHRVRAFNVRDISILRCFVSRELVLSFRLSSAKGGIVGFADSRRHTHGSWPSHLDGGAVVSLGGLSTWLPPPLAQTPTVGVGAQASASIWKST